MSTLISATKEEKSGFINFWGINAVKATRLESGAVPISHFPQLIIHSYPFCAIFYFVFFAG